MVGVTRSHKCPESQELTISCRVQRRRLGVMALIEFVRFRVRPENVAALLRARAAMIEAFRMDNPGYVGGVMARIGEQDWIDLAVWQSESCCQDALAAAVRPATVTICCPAIFYFYLQATAVRRACRASSP